jgi:hypothetical protein
MQATVDHQPRGPQHGVTQLTDMPEGIVIVFAHLAG